MSNKKKVFIILGVLITIVVTFLVGLFVGQSNVTKPDLLITSYGQTFYATIEKIRDNKYISVKGLEVNDINYRGEFSLTIKDSTIMTWRGESISISDLDLLSIGMVNDMFIERKNDEYEYPDKREYPILEAFHFALEMANHQGKEQYYRNFCKLGWLDCQAADSKPTSRPICLYTYKRNKQKQNYGQHHEMRSKTPVKLHRYSGRKKQGNCSQNSKYELPLLMKSVYSCTSCV